MTEPFVPPQGWRAKFANALRGVALGVRTENSFVVHLPAAVIVLALALWLQLDAARCAVLVVCIFSVCGAELFNAAIERLARAVDQSENPQLKDALDLASGAVLLISMGATLVGAILFISPALELFRAG